MGHRPPAQRAAARVPKRRRRRAKACPAPHLGLYCQRTHFSSFEIEMVLMRDPVEQEMAMLPGAADPKSIAVPINHQLDLRLIRYACDERMVNLWKAGAFDDLFGPCTAKGVIMKPSPKEYVEARPCRRQGDSGVPSSQGLRPAAPDRPPE